jgi:phosphatidylinositol kinase/protein kinase (PI-3  family)
MQIQFTTSMATLYVLYDEADGLCVLCVKVHHLHLQVSQELIRMAILWHEMWHEALEEASRQYFGESNVEAMLSTLMPLHEMMQANGGITLKEIAFVKVSLPSEWNS